MSSDTSFTLHPATIESEIPDCTVATSCSLYRLLFFPKTYSSFSWKTLPLGARMLLIFSLTSSKIAKESVMARPNSSDERYTQAERRDGTLWVSEPYLGVGLNFGGHSK